MTESYATGREPTSQGRPTVYFDGTCPLCTAEIIHYRSRKGGDQIEFVDVSQGADPGDGLTCEIAMQRFHVRLPNGELRSGAAGFVAIWETLPEWRWLARVARLPGVIRVMELAYRAFLPMRPFLSRIAHVFGAEPFNRT